MLQVLLGNPLHGTGAAVFEVGHAGPVPAGAGGGVLGDPAHLCAADAADEFP